MHAANVSPAKKGEGSYAIFTDGDEGEQFIANVLPAAMVSQLSSKARQPQVTSLMHMLSPRACPTIDHVPTFAAVQIRAIVV
jgi:hypothetical protein